MAGLGGSGRSRRTLRTPERREVVLRNLRSGFTRAAAAAQAGMSHDTLQRWMRADASMQREVVAAEGVAEARMTAVVVEDAFGRPAQYDAAGRLIRAEVKPNPESAWKWLERYRREEYGQHINRDVRGIAKSVADEMGLSVEEVLAEAEALLQANR